MKIKRKCYLLVLVLGCMVACKKNDDADNKTGDFYFRFKVNGILQEYGGDVPNNMIVYSPVNDGLYSAVIHAIKSQQDANGSPAKHMMSIAIYSNAPIAAGKAYNLQDPARNGASQIASIVLVYTDAQGKAYSASLLQSNYPLIDIHDAGNLRFDEISEKASKGTFSALAVGTTDRSEIMITEGEFFLKDAKSLQ